MISNKKLKIAIVGGSIGGCSIAKMLHALGHEIKIYERRSKIDSYGTGITLPLPLIKQLEETKLVDKLKNVQITQRQFFVRNNHEERWGKKIWTQAISAGALQWSELFEKLKNNIPAETFRMNRDVANIKLHKVDQSAELIFSQGQSDEVDLVICADGYASIGRKILHPNISLNYAGYIAWRGISPAKQYFFDDTVRYYGTNKGHLIIYPIYRNEEKYLNWVFYETVAFDKLQSVLTDAYGNTHQIAVSSDVLTNTHKNLLHHYAETTLPTAIAEIVCLTEKPFLQTIHDCNVPKYYKENLVLLGDAATILRPHVGSGTAKAIYNAFSLRESLQKKHSVESALQHWNSKEVAEGTKQFETAHVMSEGLVLNTPSWQTMNQNTMNEWWQNLMTGKQWYITDDIEKNTLRKR